MLNLVKYSKFLHYLTICISLFFLGCTATFNSPISSRLDVQQNQKQVLVEDVAAVFCPMNKTKSEFYVGFHTKNICLWPSHKDVNNVNYGYELVKIIPAGTEVKLIRFYSQYGLLDSSSRLILQIPTVFEDKEIILSTHLINQLLGLEYSQNP